MRILICTNHFYPENFRVNDIAFSLAKEGHDVTVLTAIPDYPLGKYFDGYGIFKRRKETIHGVKVIRGFIIPRGNGDGKHLMINYLSFFISSFFISLWLGVRHRYDAIFVHETSPVMIGVPAVMVKKIRKCPIFFWVLDLWPESLQAAGGINSDVVLDSLTKLTTWIYKNSDKILISSKGFEKSILEKGDFKNKLVYYPNWPDAFVEDENEPDIPSLPNGFNVMFAGNVGEAQDFEHVMEAALRLKDYRHIHFIIIGDGRKLPWVKAFVQERQLQDTVHLLGRFPVNLMPAFYRKAGVMLVSLKDEPIFNLTAPAKIQGYMAAGKYIVAMMNGEGPRIIQEADCGSSVSAGDSKGLSELILKLSQESPQLLESKGANGKRYQETHFTLQRNLDCLYNLFERTT
jgi:glycosyltransferase involved in cell wall biosynthesis